MNIELRSYNLETDSMRALGDARFVFFTNSIEIRKLVIGQMYYPLQIGIAGGIVGN